VLRAESIVHVKDHITLLREAEGKAPVRVFGEDPEAPAMNIEQRGLELAALSALRLVWRLIDIEEVPAL
jgi:hypothetical protein